MKKTKTKKIVNKPAVKSHHQIVSVLGRHFAVWLTLIVVTIVAVGYQIVRANNDDGLRLSAPSGTIQREVQLDTIEMNHEAQSDGTYDQQQAVNARGDTSSLASLAEVTNDAAH